MAMQPEALIWVPPEKLAEYAGAVEPWAFYEKTQVRFEAADLAGTVRPVPGGGWQAPPLGPLHVIAVEQPDPNLANDRNEARMTLLDKEIKAGGWSAVRAVGSSFDGAHSEECRAIFGLTDRQARVLGCQFGQVAVFAWRGPQWSILACATDRQSHSAWTWQPAAGLDFAPVN